MDNDKIISRFYEVYTDIPDYRGQPQTDKKKKVCANLNEVGKHYIPGQSQVFMVTTYENRQAIN